MAASFSNELVVSGSPEVEVKGLTDHVIQNLILQHASIPKSNKHCPYMQRNFVLSFRNIW